MSQTGGNSTREKWLLSNEIFFLSDLKEAKNFVNPKKTRLFLEYVKDKLVSRKAMLLNVGVFGNSKCGKTSHIKTWLRLKEEEEISQDIMAQWGYCKGYKILEYNIMLWKLPSIDMPYLEYLKDVGFTSYDFFLILGCEQFLQVHGCLANHAAEAGKGFFFVRTKIDEAICRERDFNPETFIEKPFIDEVKNNINRELRCLIFDFESENNIFIVSNRDRDKWEFGKLIGSILEKKDRIKLTSTLLSLQTLLEFFVNEKKKYIHEKYLWIHITSVLVLLFPFPLTFFLVNWCWRRSFINDCRNFYNIENEQLGSFMTKEEGKLYEEIKKVSNWPILFIELVNIIRISCFLTTHKNLTNMLIFQLIPSFGCAALSKWYTQKLLNRMHNNISSEFHKTLSNWMKKSAFNFLNPFERN